MTSPGLTKVTEGTTELLVPDNFCRKGPGARSGDLFYNKQMEFSRDVSVMFGRAMFSEGQRILDGLAATGARGLRLANECGVKAEFQLNDRNIMAAVLMRQNAATNSLDHVAISCRDLRALLSEEKFDYIDVDPFGSPVPFVDAALQSCRTRGVVAITATDTAPLYGTYPKTSLRRYGALSARSPFAHETGLRILIGYMIREAAKHDRACEPILCYHSDHYFRCYFRVVNGASRANTLLDSIGYSRYDRASLERGISVSRESASDAGPLWLGRLMSPKVLGQMDATLDLGTHNRCRKALEVWREEADSPALFYKVDELAKRTKHSPAPLDVLIEAIRNEGHSASRTHFDPKGVKTDMECGRLLKLFSSL